MTEEQIIAELEIGATYVVSKGASRMGDRVAVSYEVVLEGLGAYNSSRPNTIYVKFSRPDREGWWGRTTPKQFAAMAKKK